MSVNVVPEYVLLYRKKLSIIARAIVGSEGATTISIIVSVASSTN